MATFTDSLKDAASVAGAGFLGASGPSGRASATSLLNNRLRLAEAQRQSDLELSQLAEEKERKKLTQMVEMVKTGLTDPASRAAIEASGDLEKFQNMGRTALSGLGQPPELVDLFVPEAADADKGFTLSQGQERFDASGNRIASVDPKSKLLTPQELAQQKEIRAAGKTEISILDKAPTIDQMTKLIGPNGETPEIGETLGELQTRGFKVRSRADQKVDKQAQAAQATLKTLEELANPVFTGEEGIQNRLFDNAVNTWNRIGQTDKDLALFEAFSQGTVASLVRAVGEKGAQSNQDIQRGLNLIPTAGDGITKLPDTREVALGKLKQLSKWFDASLGVSKKEPKKDVSIENPANLTDEQLLKGF